MVGGQLPLPGLKSRRVGFGEGWTASGGAAIGCWAIYEIDQLLGMTTDRVKDCDFGILCSLHTKPRLLLQSFLASALRSRLEKDQRASNRLDQSQSRLRMPHRSQAQRLGPIESSCCVLVARLPLDWTIRLPCFDVRAW